MRRDTHALTVSNADWMATGDTPTQPTLTIRYADSRARLRARLTDPDGSLLDATEIDVTFRGQPSESGADPQGVLAVTNNVTGDYILEHPTDAAPVEAVVSAARRYADATGHDTTYTLRLLAGDEAAMYEKRVFLVYGPAGALRRRHSLIPNGIEV